MALKFHHSLKNYYYAVNPVGCIHPGSYRIEVSVVNVQSIIHEAIKCVWTDKVKKDYDSSWLYREDFLKNAFYHHLRTYLGDSYYHENSLRIFTEFRVSEQHRADLVVVKTNLDQDIESIPVLVEFKYKGAHSAIEPFYSDVRKIGQLMKIPLLAETHFYLAFIHEYEYLVENSSWLDGR